VYHITGLTAVTATGGNLADSTWWQHYFSAFSSSESKQYIGASGVVMTSRSRVTLLGDRACHIGIGIGIGGYCHSNIGHRKSVVNLESVVLYTQLNSLVSVVSRRLCELVLFHFGPK